MKKTLLTCLTLGWFSFSLVRGGDAGDATGAPSEREKYQQLSESARTLGDDVLKQNETAALTGAIKLLKAIPVQDSIRTVTENGETRTYDYLPQRMAALKALQTFDALDEYLRKVKAYYKSDPGNLTYDLLMAEALTLQNPAAATPFLEKAHALAPDNGVVAGNLAIRYAAEGNDAALRKLLDATLQKNLAIPVELPMDVVGVYSQANQLGQLTQLFVKNLQNADTPSEAGGGDPKLGHSLEQALTQRGRKDDLIAFYQACAAAKLEDFAPGVRLAELGLQSGDRDLVEQQCEARFFPPKTDRRLSASPLIGIGSASDLAQSPLLDVLRLARSGGRMEQMKKRAEADFELEKRQHGGGEERLMLVLVFAHDPEALTRLPDYLQALVADPQNKMGGTPYTIVYVLFNELLQWPEAHDQLKPTLQAAIQLQKISQPGQWMEVAQTGAALALKIKEPALAQEILRDALGKVGIGPDTGNAAPPATAHIFYDGLVPVARLLVQAGMAAEFQQLVGLIADPAKLAQGRSPDSRSEHIAELGEAALDAGDIASAKVCAEAACAGVKKDWQDPNQNSNGYYSVTVTANGIQQTGDFLLRLGLRDEFDDLQKVLAQPPAAQLNLDMSTILADGRRLRAMLDDHPHGLTPALWLDAVTDGTLTRKAAWDFSAQPGNGGQGGGDPFPDPDAPTMTQRNRGSSGGEMFATGGQALAQLDGKFDLQILAGPSPEDLRVVQLVKAANARGTADLTLQADDRFIRALGQTAETPPHIFLGPVLPVSLGANLVVEPLRQLLYSFAIYSSPPNNTPVAMTTDHSVAVESEAGGPLPGADFETVTCPSQTAKLELVGPRVPLTPGTTYCQSGWLKGEGNWGFRYVDADGHTTNESTVASPMGKDKWHFSQQIFTAPDDPVPSAAPPSPRAVAIEPFLRVMQLNSMSWQGLYLGIAQAPPVAPKPEAIPAPAPLMEGLAGATAIVESPQGGVLAAVFATGEIRCFDLATHHELGAAAKLPGTPVDVAFYNGGKDVVAADTSGNLVVRPVQSKGPAPVIYHAPGPIDYLSASPDGTVAAVADRMEGSTVAVVNLRTGRALSRIQLPSPRFATMIVSADGKYVYVKHFESVGQIWDSLTGALVPMPAPPAPTPHFSPGPMAPGERDRMMQEIEMRNAWSRKTMGTPYNDIAVAHLFQLPRTVKVSEWQRPCWLQVQAGYYVMSLDNFLVYGMSPDRDIFARVKTGPVIASCLSSQGDEVYTVDAKGALTAWKLPPDVTIPPLTPPPEIKMVDAGPTAAHQLIIEVPGRVRGFPKTTLSSKLVVSVMDQDLKPAAGAQIEVQSDLPGAMVRIAGTGNFQSHLKLAADADGLATIEVRLGDKPGDGKINLSAEQDDVLKKCDVALESIDETKPLNQPQDVISRPEGGAYVVTWTDAPDNRTTTVFDRQVDGGPWRTLALLPEDATSYTDRDTVPGHTYVYRVCGASDSNLGYPARPLPPADRLGDFLP